MAATIVQYLGTGRRKTSVARVFMRPGKGEIKVNGRTFESYFPTESSRATVRQALAATETTDKFDLIILASGGGVAGQAGAVRLGVSRALVEFNAELRGRLAGVSPYQRAFAKALRLLTGRDFEVKPAQERSR